MHAKRRGAALFLASYLLQTHYNYHTHVVLQARMPVCTVLEACTPIVSERPVHSLAAPQATANSSVARMLHATPVQHGHVKGILVHKNLIW